MKLKLIVLLNILGLSSQMFGWSNVWQMRNESDYPATIQSANAKSGDNQNGIRMEVPPAFDIGCNLKLTGVAVVEGDAHECAFILPPRAKVVRTWGFYIGDSAHGNYTKVTVRGREYKFQDISYAGDYVRMNDDDKVQWPQSNFNIVIQKDGTPTLEVVNK